MLDAVKSMLHTQQNIPTFPGYDPVVLPVSQNGIAGEGLCAQLVVPATPGAAADPALSAAAAQVLASLQQATSRSDKRLVIGQTLRAHDYEAGGIAEPLTRLTALNMPLPKLIEVDVKDFDIDETKAWEQRHRDELYDVLTQHAANGGLIGITYHAPNPFPPHKFMHPERGTVRLAELADPAHPASAEAMAWRNKLDFTAGVLKKLENLGAVVLFRPLHESNGDWFWWGDANKNDFIGAWRGVFNYLTVDKGIHNLLWVYSANFNEGGDMDPTEYFPGNGFADIVGLDMYENDLGVAAPGATGYDALRLLGKPFALTEYGPDNADTTVNGDALLPNDEVIEAIKTHYPETVLATAWYSSCLPSGAPDCVKNNWQISDKRNPAALLQDPWSIVR